MLVIKGLVLDDNGKIKIPSHIKKIRFDIGLSYCAPNSALWLNNDDVFVIGVEANKFCIETIKTKGLYCQQKGVKITYPNENFMLINCALDDVEDVVMKKFYHMEGDPGTSSLLDPTKNLRYGVKEVSDVVTIPFSYLLDKLSFENFDYIEMVKIDTQGKDLDIIKSAKGFLENIVYLNAEINTFEYY